MNAGDVVAGPDGRTYLVLGVRPGNGLRALERMQAPPPLLTWLRQRPALSWQEAWDTCEHGDLLAWLVMRLAGDNGSPSQRRATGCLVEIVYALAWPWLHDRDEDTIAAPVRQCLDGIARYVDGEDVDLRALTGKARSACAASPAWCAAAAVWYATIAAVEPADIWRAQRAADAVCSGAEAATVAVGIGTRYDALRCAAEIVRVHYPAAPEIGGAP